MAVQKVGILVLVVVGDTIHVVLMLGIWPYVDQNLVLFKLNAIIYVYQRNAYILRIVEIC